MARRTVLTGRQRSALFSFPQHEADLLRHYTLSDEDLQHIEARRRPRNKLGFALQLVRAPLPGCQRAAKSALYDQLVIQRVFSRPPTCDKLIAMDPGAYREMIESQRTHWWFAVRRRFLASWVRMDAGFRGAGRILEVGAGTGANLDTLRAFGRVTALEPDSFACDYVSRHFDVETVNAALPNDAAGLGDFDLVVALDVLEHIDDDLAALRSMHGMLKQRGSVIVTVPAYRFLWSVHDERLHHKRRYRSAELARKMEAAGFRITHRAYFNSLLFPAVVPVRLLDRILKGVGHAGGGSVHPWLNDLLARVFGLEVLLSRLVRFPFGLSLVAVGSKPA